MKHSVILAAALLAVLYYIIAGVIWQLKNRSFRRRVITGVLILALLASQIDFINIFAQTGVGKVAAAEQETESGGAAEGTVEVQNPESGIITAFAELPDDIREQVVPVGTTLEELMLPDTLEVVCVAAETNTGIDTENADEQSLTNSEDGTDSENSEVSQETITIEHIVWQSEPEYDGDTEGKYIFTTVLPEGYELTEEVNVPQITVMVGETDDIALLSGDIMPIAITFDGGTGSKDSPYLISNLTTLKNFRDDVTNNGNDYSGKYIQLTTDIDLDGSASKKWTRIGTWNSPFRGTFDGDGHTISGLYVDESSNDQGLFGSVKSGTIRNLSVSGSVYVPDSGTVIYNVAGIVGIVVEGTIENCTNYVTVSGRDYVGGICGLAGKDSKITNCTNKGSVTGQAVVGGIVGKSDNTNASSKSEGTAGTISGCTNSGTITAKNVQGGAEDHTGAGGIAGANHDSGVIKDCRNDGQVNGYVRVGGIAGYDQPGNKGTIRNCYNTGNVYGYNDGVKNDDGYEHGGIVGYAPYVAIEQCYNTGSIYGKDQIGGIAGKIDKNDSYIKNSCNLGSVRAYGNDCGGIAGQTYNEVKITYCYSSGTLTCGTNRGGIVGKSADGWVWMGNCYYLSGTASGECGTGNNYKSDGGEIKTMTKTELESGEFALYLQGKLGGSLVWVHNLKNVYGNSQPTSKGPIPTGDSKLKVLTVTFMKKGSGTSYNTTHAKRYTNPYFGVTMPTDLNPSDSDKYKVVWWTSANAPTSGKQFTADSTVTSDMTVYAYEQEMYAGESSTITKTVTYGNGGTVTLSDSMKYAAGTSSAGKFTYTIKSGNTALKATISGDTLTIPTNAGAGDYTLNITASEKSPQVSTYALGSYGTGDVTLTVEVTINKANSSVTKKPAANSLTYTGSAQALVTAGTGSGGTMQYSTAGSSAGFSENIPKGTDAGTYTVWYKVAGNANYNETTAQSVSVIIGKAPVKGTLGIDGTRKYGQTLTGSLSGVSPSGAKESDFTYTWKRDNDIISGASGSAYTLTKDDIGHTLTLTAAAKMDSNYTGSLETTTETIEKADGPAVSGVSKTDETVKGKKDGTLTGLDTTMEYKLSTGESYTSVTTAGTVSGLAPGTYDVRVKETDTHNAGGHSSYTIGEGAGLTVTFDSNGGSTVSDTTGISYDTTISAPTAPTRNGYDFDGWYKESGLTNKWDFANDTVTDNITLYAKWSINGYNIIYKDEGDVDFSGMFTGDYPTVHAYGTETVLVSPNKMGYSFKGWYNASGCTGDPVTSLAATEYTADITLYAKWVDDIAPEITLSYSYEPTGFLDWIIGNRSLVVTVHVTEEGSGADEIRYTVTESGKVQGEDETAAIEDGAATITVNADFKGTIKIACTDNDDNTSEEVTVGEELVGKDNINGIIIEDHAPRIGIANGIEEIASSVYYDPEELNLTVSITDEVNGSGSAVISSGIASVAYQIGSGTEKSVDKNYTTELVTKCSFTIPSSELDAGENKITVTATDNAGNKAESDFTVCVTGPEMMPNAKIDYTSETLTGLVPGAEYTVNEVTKTAVNGIIAIEESWLGSTITIIRNGNKNGTTFDSDAQLLSIPTRPAAPTVPELSERSDTSITLAVVTDAEYRIDGGSWQSSVTFSGLTQKTQYSFEAYFPATQSSFCSLVSGTATIATRPAPPIADKLIIDYIAETFGLAQGVEAFCDAGSASSVEAGDITGYMGKTIYIRYSQSSGFPESLNTAISIPERPAAPSDFTANNATYPGASDGTVTGLDTGYAYEISDDGGSTWKDAIWNSTAVTGLSAGSYQLRIKAAADKNFRSAASAVTVNETPSTPEQKPGVEIDRENGNLTGLEPNGEYTVNGETRRADENGNIHIEDEWADGSVDIVKKGNGTTTEDSPAQTVDIPKKEDKPEPIGVDATSGKANGKITNLKSNETYEISKDGGETWETVTSDKKGIIYNLAKGDYLIRTKAKVDTICSDSAECRIGSKKRSTGGGSTGGDSGDNSGGSDGSAGGGSSDNTGDSGSSAGDGSSGNTGDSGSPVGGGSDNTGNGTGSGSGTGSTGQDTDAAAGKSAGTDQDSGQSGDSGTDTPISDKMEGAVQAELKDDEIVIIGGTFETDGAATGSTGADGETADAGASNAAGMIITGTIRAAEAPATPIIVGQGSVTVTVVSDDYRCNAGVADTVAVANAVLTSEQKQLVNGGTTMEIRVEVKDIYEQIPELDRNTIEEGLKEDRKGLSALKLGTYIDISMYVRMGENDWEAVTAANRPIDVIVEIPEELQSVGEEFYIVRSHEGEYALLHDLDSELDTVTVRTELFSTYAIAYILPDMAGENTGRRCALCHICPTFFGGCCFVWLVIVLAAAGIVVFLIDKKRGKSKGI